MHCLVYQTITTPDRLIFLFYGPEVGLIHDTTHLRNHGIEGTLQDCLLIEGHQDSIYANVAYVLIPWL